jgi:hypothetical protein
MITKEALTRVTGLIACVVFGNFFVILCLFSFYINKLFTAMEKTPN